MQKTRMLLALMVGVQRSAAGLFLDVVVDDGDGGGLFANVWRGLWRCKRAVISKRYSLASILSLSPHVHGRTHTRGSSKV
ncbi:hypothetical protein GQ42DRAFT_165921 [Ramicandelaber brevisporus]|nr:hypothetical protein GQ42DRAFT_165989 [Ramicandelaber brevisporus]KAI8865715.1 hypothetical protein GQ42DRAFT_165921 [Ramicandelaber brevisporus]